MHLLFLMSILRAEFTVLAISVTTIRNVLVFHGNGVLLFQFYVKLFNFLAVNINNS